jgi:hypothetical protein
MNADTSAVMETPPAKTFGHSRPTSNGFGFSVGRVYHLWLASWETELGAVTIASQTGTLSTSEAAAHRAMIAAEREIVIKQLTPSDREPRR